MALTPKNSNLDLTASLADVYTVPAATGAIVTLVQVANIDGVVNVDIDVLWTDASNSNKVTYLAKTVSVPANASLSVIGGKLTLETGDKIRAKASSVSTAQISVSVMEVT